MYYWIRYYTIALLTFDVIQIHLFARPGITSDVVCVATDPITRVAGVISLWSVEIIMQLRVYALFKCSKRVAIFNLVLFSASIGAFCWIVVYNTRLRSSLIASAVRMPLPGCPTINGGNMAWALWIPATVYERSYALGEARPKFTLQNVLIHDNLLYFFTVASILVFNNLMVIGKTHIPWFSFGPFHASVGILTGRMLVHLRKASLREIPLGTITVDRLEWAHTTLEEVSQPDFIISSETTSDQSAQPPRDMEQL
ncbi:hypothetical protein BDN72DRAFT_556687 [Pluteus cervinus]|uniref:Uncharacterized protein n=1 Tax=Pluteus cervinus TaxID=181527 RepID=A0ACD3BBW8_9AGAR|nr:hypothetical protein BDN72DRAFT_556687 [Pluteus cervinus]